MILYIVIGIYLPYNTDTMGSGASKNMASRMEENMTISKAQQKATAKYESKVYDKTLIRLPKGNLDIIKAHAESRGESVNGFINRAIKNQMSADKKEAGGE